MRRSALLLALGISTVAASSAHAGLMAELVPAGPVPSGSNFAFNYNILFAGTFGNDRLDTNDYVTIYDVASADVPLISATAPAGWTVAVQPLGTDGPNTLPSDNPSLFNVTYTYTGAPVLADTIFSGFSLVSSFGSTVIDHYTSQRTDNLGSDAGSKVGEIGSVAVPAVPEPSSLAALGVAGLLLSRRRTR